MLHKNNYSGQILFGRAKSDLCEVEIHLHDSCEIFMALSDNINYFVEDHVYNLAKGDLILTNPLELHRPQVTNGTPYERRFIQFKPQLFSHLLDKEYNPLKIFTHRTAGNGNKIELSTSGSSHAPLLIECFDSIEALHTYDDAQNQLLLYSKLLQLLIHLYEIYNDQPQPTVLLKTMDIRVQKMLTLIEKNFQTKISLDFLCNSLYMDKYYMSHLFKEATGFTIMEYIQSKRIQLAK
ncbi:MAG TPA: AraC family ligand binding domain-containing protein, partial [Lachnospiraceae bacterium]|nr:AraC family ligand binding domain-containing protein [Lachnospiraceae bacterium]